MVFFFEGQPKDHHLVLGGGARFWRVFKGNQKGNRPVLGEGLLGAVNGLQAFPPVASFPVVKGPHDTSRIVDGRIRGTGVAGETAQRQQSLPLNEMYAWF